MVRGEGEGLTPSLKHPNITKPIINRNITIIPVQRLNRNDKIYYDKIELIKYLLLIN